GELLLKISGMRAGKRGNHVPDLAVLEHQAQLAIVCSAVIADCGDVFGAFQSQRLDQVIGKSRATESAEHDASAVWNIGHGRIQACVDFVSHGSAYPTRGGASLQKRVRRVSRYQ